MIIKKLLTLAILAGLTSTSYSSEDADARALKSQAQIKKILAKRPVIEGKKNPEKIPQRAVLKHFLSNLKHWGVERTQSVLAKEMNIGTLKADWLFTLAEQVSDDQHNLQFEFNVCDFIKSKSANGKPVSDEEMVGYYTSLMNKSRKIDLDAGVAIEKELTPLEYQRFQHYLKTKFVPTMWYRDSHPRDMLNVYDKPLAERHTECQSKQ